GSAHFQVRNTGNVSLNAVARVKAVDTFGHTIKQYKPTRFGPLLPGANVTVSEPTIGLPRAGLVTYKITVTASGTPKASAEVRQLIIPWALMAIPAALLGACILWGWQRRRRRRRGPQPAKPTEPEPEPETAEVQ